MKILITGASGFIGGRLLQAICDAYGKNNVIAFSSQLNAACETIIYSDDDYRISKTDIVKFEQVELLIHAGAYTPKNGGETNAIFGCNSNIYYTEKLLNLPFSNLKKIVYLSTVDVYQLACLIDESTPTLPKTLYGMSKLYCENIVNIYAKKNKIDLD